MMSNRQIFFVCGLFLLLGIASYLGRQYWQRQQLAKITTFDQCQQAGYPVQESYPPVCQVPSGERYVLFIGNELEKLDLIKVSQPRPTTIITSPVKITGEARGTWFFEGSFPIKLEDAQGKVLGTGIAQAQGEWMTTEFVPFTAEVSFSAPAVPAGTLILEKDNPSGLPEHADQLNVPIRFK